MAKKRTKKEGRCRAGGRWLRNIQGDEHPLRRYCHACGRLLKCRLSKSGRSVQLPGHNSRSKDNARSKYEWMEVLRQFSQRYWMEDVETMKARVRRVKASKPVDIEATDDEAKGGKSREKIKRRKVKEDLAVRRLEIEIKAMWGDVDDYLERARRCATTFSFRRYVRDRYVQVFGTRAPEETHPALVHAAVAYELQYRGFESVGKLDQLSPAFLERREAALGLKLSGFPEDTRGIIEVFMQVVGDGRVSDNHVSKSNRSQTMSATSTKDSSGRVGRSMSGKTSGLSNAACWIKVFKDNSKKTERKTDEQISKFMAEEFPNSKQTELKHVTLHRRLYNQGKIRGQEGEPKVTSYPYDADGTKLPLPTRGGGRKKTAEEKAEQATAKKAAKAKASDAVKMVKGMRVWSDEFGQEFKGKVTAVKGNSVSVLFDDGDTGSYSPSDLHVIETATATVKAPAKKRAKARVRKAS